MQTKVAIIVGHSKEKQGAINYLGESEYSFNSRIAKKLDLRLGDCSIDSEIFYRRNGYYKQTVREVAGNVLQFAPILSIELHFNSYDNEAFGAEVLVDEKADALFAELFLYETSKLGIRDRGIKVLKENDRGFINVHTIQNPLCNAYLVEPTFCDFRNYESKEIFENEDNYVELLHTAIVKYIRNHIHQ